MAEKVGTCNSVLEHTTEPEKASGSIYLRGVGWVVFGGVGSCLRGTMNVARLLRSLNTLYRSETVERRYWYLQRARSHTHNNTKFSS